MGFLLFALLGLGTGAIFSLLSQGLVLIYRGSGLLNLSQGAVAMFGAYIYFFFASRLGCTLWLSLIASLFFCAVLGALIQVVVLRNMRKSSPLSRVIATLGVVLILQSAAYLSFGHDPLAVPSLFPTKSIYLFSNSLLIPEDFIFIFTISMVLSGVLYVVYRYTNFGRVTAAVAEHEVAAASLGYSPNAVALTNWAIGSMLAGFAGVLIAPIIFLEPTALVLLVIPATAAALIGEFKSFPITLLAALVLGVAESELQRYVDTPGWGSAAPFLVVILVLIIRGRNLPLRSFILDRLPAVGNGRPRWLAVAFLGGALGWVTLISGANWSAAIATTASFAIICLSVVVLTGYAGQLSLAQFVLAGVGALFAGRLAPHMPFILALIVGAALTGVIGGLVGLPALRTRGTTLAVATLGLGAAIVAVVLNNNNYTGSVDGASGLTVPPPTIFGWNAGPLFHGNRYAFVVVVVLVIISLGVANLRRSALGRRLLAVRSNEQAAAALGINVAGIKTFAFVVSAMIAGAGGIMLAFEQPTIGVGTFDVFTCILIVAGTVVGGVGNIGGAYIGSLIIAGGVTSQLFSGFSEINDYLPLVGGFVLILNLVSSPDGLFELNRRIFERQFGRLAKPLANRWPSKRKGYVVLAHSSHGLEIKGQNLTVASISVSFGGVHAVRDVSLTINPGEIHGLIGPNGAGKTTLIDAITGFVRTSQGDVLLGGVIISRWSPNRRAVSGLSRSFQSLELFNDLTIAENLAVAEDMWSWRHFVADYLIPGRIDLGPGASEGVRHFGLEEFVDRKPTEVSFGQRKTVAIARSIASSPSVLLLDEPAAGLDDRETDELAMMIRRLAKDWNLSILLVEHKVDMIMSISDRVTVMENGSVLASGSPNEIRNNPGVITAYLGTEVA